MPVQLKRGRWGKDEIKLMKEKSNKLPVEQIAKILNRDVKTVHNWIKENLALDLSDGVAVPLLETEMRNELRATPEWQELRQQFTETELKLFEHEYGQFMAQFKGDVWATEKIQIFLLIKLDILMNRNLKQRQRAVVDIERMERQLEDMYKVNGARVSDWDDKDQARLANLEQQLASCREAQMHMTSEYLKLSEKHSTLMKELKGTREQRITKIENSRETFLSIIKMFQDEEIRQREGEEIELMKLATQKERERLSQSHRYIDDTIDQPLLTPENVGNSEDVSHG